MGVVVVGIKMKGGIRIRIRSKIKIKKKDKPENAIGPSY